MPWRGAPGGALRHAAALSPAAAAVPGGSRSPLLLEGWGSRRRTPAGALDKCRKGWGKCWPGWPYPVRCAADFIRAVIGGMPADAFPRALPFHEAQEMEAHELARIPKLAERRR